MMIKFALKNPRVFIIVFMALLVAGCLSFLSMPRSEDPQVSQPATSIIVLYPGASAIHLEQLVVNHLEAALNDLEEVKEIKTEINDGIVKTHVHFYFGTDAAEMHAKVITQVAKIRGDLPSEITSIKFRKWSLSKLNIMQFAITNDSVGNNYDELKIASEVIENELKLVPGVQNIKIWGLPEKKIKVMLDSSRIAQYKISVNQVIEAIKRNGKVVPVGKIKINSLSYNIVGNKSVEKIADLKEIPIIKNELRVIQLKDIASVEFQYEDSHYFTRYNGQEALFVTFGKRESANIMHVSKQVNHRIKECLPKLPLTTSLFRVYDQSEDVKQRLDSFFYNLGYGIMIVALINFLFFRLRSALVISIAIPFSILFGILFLNVFGFGLEQMSIAGLIIAVGLLVDNAIVAVEAINLKSSSSMSLDRSILSSITGVARPIISGTLTTICAFLPVVFIQDVTGDFIRSLPITVIFTLIGSLIMSLVLCPLLSSKLLNKPEFFLPTKLVRFLQERVFKWVSLGLDLVFRWPKGALLVLLAPFLCSLFLLKDIPMSFFPDSEKARLIINVDLRRDVDLTTTSRVVREIESLMLELKEIVCFASTVGRSNPYVYYNLFAKRATGSHAQIIVEIDQQENVSEVKRYLTSRITKMNIMGVVNVFELKQGPPVDAEIAINLMGENLDELARLSKDVKEVMSKVEGVTDIQNPFDEIKSDIYLNINKEKAILLGVSLAQVYQVLRVAFSGEDIDLLKDKEGRSYKIKLLINSDKKGEMAFFDELFFISNMGGYIPLKQIADYGFEERLFSIEHHNLLRGSTITAEAKSGYSTLELTRLIKMGLDKIDWPEGYRYRVEGDKEVQERAFGKMYMSILISIAGIFSILVLQFRSFIQPFIVLFMIPLSVSGSVLALFLTENPFSFTALVGLSGLFGIVVNDTILLVDELNRRLSKGASEGGGKAIILSVQSRFVPIVLTSLTTILGLLPLTLRGGGLWAPMGWAIIGGLLSATILSLLVVPVLLKIYIGLNKK